MTVGLIEAIAFGVTKEAVTALVKPILASTFSGLRSLSTEAISSFGDRFSDYVIQQAERQSCLSTIVFGHQKSLSELYLPLTVVPVRSTNKTGEADGILIDRFKTNLLPAEKRVLITDTAGMGKSTLSKFLFLQCLKSCFAIPIFLELRHLSSSSTILTVIQKQLNNTPITEDEPRFTKRQVEKILKKGGLVFFFDGYDEITFRDREVVTKDMKDFIDKYPDNTYIITSRPETGLLAFPAFKQFGIQPLTKEESFSLIRKYDQGGGRSEQLINRLQGRDFRAVQEFLKNPLLTSLLYRSFEYKQSVPLKKHIFYRQVFDALFDWHDASKDGYNTREKKSGLDIDAFHRVLRVIGFVSVMKGEIEGDTDSVLSWIRKAREICSTSSFSESQFLDDLVRAVPIFVKDGDYYRWSHKSLAEYFAAQYICTEGKAQQAAIFGAFIESGRTSRFSNVLDQVFDIDSVGFRTHLVLPLSRAFSVHWAATYKGIDPAISASSVKLRKEVTFDRISFSIPFKSLDRAHPTDEIAKQLSMLLGRPVQPEDREFTMILLEAPSKPTARILAITSGPFSTILEILQSKKDPLVRTRASIDLLEPKGLRRFPLLSTTSSILGDDPAADHNRIENFDRTTRVLLEFGAAVDSDRMLAFESTFRDSDRLVALTDELLQPILSTKPRA